MLNLVKYNNNSRRIVTNGYSLLMVSHTNELKNEQLEYLDGVIIDTNDEIHVKEILKDIRVLAPIKESLIPIFINNIYKLSTIIQVHTDGFIDLDAISSYIQRIEAIKQRIEKLTIPKLNSYEELNKYKIIAYCFTRNKVIEPITSRQSLIGYEFPYLSLLYKMTEVISMLKVVEQATQQQLLSFTLKDYVHMCKSCSGNYLNFRECCPKCESIDIKAHDMVHHFVCAHVAPEKDFKIEGGLECPKCDKQLRHIGIDYDKPSTIYSCNTCNHEFQNSTMKALCVDCSTEQDLDELLEKTIGSYSITQKGENFLFINQDLKEETVLSLGSMSLPIFKILLKQEIQRVKTNECSSFFAKIEFKNNQLQLLNTNVKEALKNEIGNIIKSYLKEADVLSMERFNKYYLLLPETNKNQLERLENIQYNLTKLLSDNLEEAQQEINIYTEKITVNNTLESYFS